MTTMTMTASADRLLAAAGKIVAAVRDCWVVTPAADGGVNARIVEPIAGVPGEEAWTIWFITNGGSRKAAEIRRAGRLTLAYQHPPDRAYVALIGRASLIADRAEIGKRWQESWRRFFPGGADGSDIVFVKIEVDRIELCVPGVTPEPFGSRYSILIREAAGQWRALES